MPAPLRGKVCLVTGATSGIGRATARALAAQGAEVFVLCRNRDKGETLLRELKQETGDAQLHLLVGDLARQADIHRVAEQFLAAGKPLHVLVNNAGIVNTERRVTADGFEEMFAVNHLGYFLLTERLRQRLIDSAPARVVSVASGAHAFVRGMNWDDLQYERTPFKTFTVYGQSKLCNILWTRELARQLRGTGVTANCLHPGAVGTGLATQNGALGKIVMWLLRPFFRSPEKGATAAIYLATAPEVANTSGHYYYDRKPLEPKPWAKDDAAAQRLWAISEQMVAGRGQ